ncbi:tetratricopeptide repeat protein [Poseidonocella sedimentorum]|uniref:Tetratricopeptide repeat-containing protein n=1 Tax=Poseidonocella sedimentorum TaxID=871652 RepID=A0A1I6EBH9_9RHOB|nr:tetratricopeptide repeat protein [Poseidonocella sedimentorum]SFR15090.1 Tetratricopeptide repeat-containing protein [Poseidonocella sedimentorum]
MFVISSGRSFFRNLTVAAVLASSALVLPGAGAEARGLAGAYLAARSAELDGDFDQAARYYARAMSADPGNPALMQGAVVAYSALGRDEQALAIARRMEAAGIESQISHLVQLAADSAAGKWDEVDAAITDGHGVGPLVDGLLQGWAHLGAGSMDAALRSFDGVIAERGMEGFGLYHKALALASVGDYEGAEAVFFGVDTSGIRKTRRGVVGCVQVLSQLGRFDDALEMIVTTFPGQLDEELQQIVDRLAAGEAIPFSLVQNPRQGAGEVFYSVAAALEGEASSVYTLLYARAAEVLNPAHTDAILLMADIFEELGRLDLTVAEFRKIPNDSSVYVAAELGRADALRRDGRRDAAIEVLERLAADDPSQAQAHVGLGDIHRQAEDFAAAVSAYDRALAAMPEAGSEAWFIYYARGIAHERLDQWDAAEADFRTALELNPDHPQVLNYLGYSLVEKGLNLSEAMEMIATAVAARPDNGYIVDSLGWGLYRLGRYDEAVGHMERAAELMPVDPIVNDHLGDVYWAVGRKMEARFQWMRALSFDPEEAEAERIRRKLEVGLDRVLAEEGAAPLVDLADGRQ